MRRLIIQTSYLLFFGFYFLFSFNPILSSEGGDRSGLPIIALIPSYNNIAWYEENLTSVFTQEYRNYRVIYINDCSNDGTGAAVENYLSRLAIDYRVIDFDCSLTDNIAKSTDQLKEMINKDKVFFTLVNNKMRCGALANLYRAIHSCEDNAIIATIDGDDRLAHSHVFEELNQVYASGNVWLTHGKLMEWPSKIVGWSIPIPEEIVAANAFREYRCASHLRTFYAWLFKFIKLEDLLYQGSFFKMTWDFAIMFPMCEMAGERHAFIPSVNYIYNMSNPINDNKVDAQLQRDLDSYIRNMPRYQRLEKSPM